MGLSTLTSRGPKNLHELNSPRESLLSVPHASYPSLAQSASVVQRKGDKRAVLPVSLRLQTRLSCLWSQPLAAANSRSYWLPSITSRLHRSCLVVRLKALN